MKKYTIQVEVEVEAEDEREAASLGIIEINDMIRWGVKSGFDVTVTELLSIERLRTGEAQPMTVVTL